MSGVEKWGRLTASVLPVWLLFAVIGFGAVLPGYSQWLHAVALLGAKGVAHAQAFCVAAFILPGLLAIASALTLLPSGHNWLSRIGGQLLLISGLAFCGLGLLPLDPINLDGRASQYHASAWLSWVLAFASGAGMLGMSLWQRSSCRWPSAVCLLAAVMVLMLSLLPASQWLPPPLAQRLAFLIWAMWWPIMAWMRRE